MWCQISCNVPRRKCTIGQVLKILPGREVARRSDLADDSGYAITKNVNLGDRAELESLLRQLSDVGAESISAIELTAHRP